MKITNKKQTYGFASKGNLLMALIGVSLGTLLSTPVAAEEGNPRVNQLGYLPNTQKIATYATDSTASVSWQLRQGSSVILSGQSIPKGFDSASGETVHHIDFSSISVVGDEFRLVVGNDQSYAFDINADVFTSVAYDAIKYFYHNRSGIEIKTEFTGGGFGSFANDAKWSRPAGHLNNDANQGDFGVACWPGTCNYSLDVPYGWYDAGDHGKYVVNGGISVWKLANMYETSLHLRQTAERFADNSLNIPESGNGVPDILDEIRWQMRFMLAMQVPQGEELAGMVHHKMHDASWTGIPLAPHLDSRTRLLVPPSTAATLNLAATAAQSARLWASIDPAFASECLTAAELAWHAAKQNPSVSLPDSPYNSGGGSYGDSDVSDEFLWAATELYITTGKSNYLADINVSGVSVTNYNWQQVQISALMSLATVPTPHSVSLMNQARQKLLTIADHRLSIAQSQGYLAPITAAEYDWGSNNGIANSLAILATAYDISGNDDYAQAVGYGINYLFGQNALKNSYITGHGENGSAQPHHRFWAGAVDNNYPWAPPGSLIGGPNFGLQDDISRGALDHCVSRPQTCYIDHIGAWSTNEITVNWNSALASILAFYDDYAHISGTAPSVDLTSPSTGDIFDSNENIVATAQAADSDGAVTVVSFYLNDVLHSVDQSAPYTTTLSGLINGLYTLQAQAEDNDGNRVTSAISTFRVGDVMNIPPQASFSSSATALTVNFDASASSDSDGSITNYLWDFGDGETSTAVTVQHSYASEGTYDVNLMVVDDAGDSANELQSLTVEALPVSQFSCSFGGFDIWNSGAIIRDVVITNTSNTTLNGWSIALMANSHIGVVDAWGADFSGSGLTITASGADNLAPGESVQFSGHISHNGDFSSMSCEKGQTPPGGSVDLLFQAEDFIMMSGIQTESTTDTGGGLNVGWIDAGDWLVFNSVNIPSTGSYIIEYRVASASSGGQIQLEERGGSPVYGKITVPTTGNWQEWRTIEHTLTLTAGAHEFAISAPQGGFNINWFRIKAAP